jgi:hypothetical protein
MSYQTSRRPVDEEMGPEASNGSQLLAAEAVTEQVIPTERTMTSKTMIAKGKMVSLNRLCCKTLEFN